MNISEIEKVVMARGYRFSRAWVADEVDWAYGQAPYGVACSEGDLLVEMIGYDPGSVSWVENWGHLFEGRLEV